MYKKDWLLNQIDDLVEFLAKVFLNQTTTEYLPENIVNSTSDELYNSLDKLICEKKINEAENLLFDKIGGEYVCLQSKENRPIQMIVKFILKKRLQS